jgi:hypothetical protein
VQNLSIEPPRELVALAAEAARRAVFTLKQKTNSVTVMPPCKQGGPSSTLGRTFDRWPAGCRKFDWGIRGWITSSPLVASHFLIAGHRCVPSTDRSEVAVLAWY